MIKISKQKIFFIGLIILLLLGLSVVSAQDNQTVTKNVKMEKTVKNPVNNLVKVNSKNNQQLVTKTLTKTNVNNTNKIKENQKTTPQTKQKNKKTNTTNDKETKQITKNTIKNTKEEPVTVTVTDYGSLKGNLTTRTDEELTVILGEGTFTGNGQITVNSSIKKLIIDGNGQTFNGNSKGFLKVNNLDLTLKNITVLGCNNTTGSVLYQTGGETTIVNSTIKDNTLSESNKDNGIIKVVSGRSLILDNNTFYNNSVCSTGMAHHGFLISTTKTSKIVNNNFIDNDCNDEPNGIYAGLINILVNEIHDNTYVGNNLYVYSVFDVGQNAYGQVDVYDDVEWPIEFCIHEKYNSTVKNGTVKVEFYVGPSLSYEVVEGKSIINITYDEFYNHWDDGYTVVVTSIEYTPVDEKPSYCSDSFSIDVSLKNTTSTLTVSVSPKSAPLGSEFVLNGTLKANNRELVGYTVKLNIGNGETIELITNATGGFNYTYTPQVIGTYTATFTFDKHGGIKGTSKSITFKATGTPTQLSLSLDKTEVTVGEVVKVNGTLINNITKEGIGGATINLTFNNTFVASNTTDSEGNYVFYYVTNVLSTSNNNLKVSFGPDVENSLEASSNSTRLRVNKIFTYIVFTATNVTKGEPVTISGYVYNANTNQVIIHTGSKLIRIKNSDDNSNNDVDLKEGYFEYTYTPTRTGEFSVNVTFNRGNTGNYNQSKNTTKYTVALKTNMTIIHEEAITVGQTVNIRGVLSVQDTTTTAIKNTKVYITVGNKINEPVDVNENGQYEFSCQMDEVGNFTITVTYISDSTLYVGSTNTSKVEVLPRATNMTISNDEEIVVGTDVTIRGRLTAGMDAVGNTIVYITIGTADPKTVDVDEEGYFVLECPVEEVGDLIITVKYNNHTTNYTSSTNTSKIKVNPRNTYIVIDEIQSTILGQDVTISGTLYDGEFDIAIPNTVLTIRIDKNYIDDGIRVDSEGKFIFSYKATSLGIHNVSVNYINDTTKYYNSTKNATFEIIPLSNLIITVNAVSPVKVGKTTIITGRLIDENNNPLIGETILVQLDDKVIGNALTDENGEYELKYETTRVGTFDIVAIFPENEFYDEISNFTSLTVSKLDTKLEINKLENVEIGDKIIITGKLLDEFDNPVANALINLTIDNQNITVKTDTSGIFNTTLDAKKLGEKVIEAVFAGDSKYNNASETGNVEVVKVKGSISMNLPNSIRVDAPLNVTGVVSDSKGNPIANLPVNVTVNGKTTMTTTDKKGKFNVPADNMVGGQNNVTVTAGNDTVSVKPLSTKVNARKINTIVSVNTTKEGTINEKININGKLIDEMKKPVANAVVTVSVDGVSKTVKTNSKGNYKFSYKSTTVGNKTVTAVYAGDDYYSSSEATTNVVIKEPSKITVKSKTVKGGKKVKLEAIITDRNGKLISGGKVVFKVNMKSVVDSDGKAVYVPVKKGKAVLTYAPNNGLCNKVCDLNAVYSGTSRYLESRSNTAKLTVLKRDAKVSFTKKVLKAKSFDTIKIKTKVKDKVTGKIIKSGKITYKLNSLTIGTAKINNGISTFKYKLNGKTAAIYKITAVFFSSLYNRTQKTINLTVVKTPTKIKVSPIKSKSNTVTIKAQILDNKNKPVKKTTKVSIKINGKTYVSQKKVSNGKINIEVPTDLQKGTYTLTIIAGINGYYQESRVDSKITITQ